MSKAIEFGDFEIREFQNERDSAPIRRIWNECGWLPADTDDRFLDSFYASAPANVATLDGNPECVASARLGKFRYQDDDLRLAAITSVGTSRIARKRGLARATASCLLSDVANTDVDIAVLGILEQGVYEPLGFGGGSYDHLMHFDPADLRELGATRIPQRLTFRDWEAIHDAMNARWRSHGGCTLDDGDATKSQTTRLTDGFGLGHFDDQGRLTHFFYGKLDEQYGPMRIVGMAYQNGEQLLELMAWIKSLSDQVSSVQMMEPPHLQLQDLLSTPFHSRRISKGSEFENYHRASSFWQARILNLQSCISQTHLYGPEVEFNLSLSDPIEAGWKHLRNRPTKSWTGIAGDYSLTLGEDSICRKQHKPNLPTLRASANAFTRLWLGVRSATELAITDDLHADQSLLEELDDVFRLPTAKLGWYF